MRVAILGAGFCGIAVAWHMLQHPENEVVIFDPKGIAKGTSGIAAGLLHPYAGARSKLNWRAYEGINATRKLLLVAEKALGEPVAKYEGMLRLAVTDQQKIDFVACANNYDDVHWRSAEECQLVSPQLIAHPGIFIDSAITIYCEKYLTGLWQACLSYGASSETTAVQSLQDLSDFDCIIVAMGADTTTLPELAHLPISRTKGQLLEFSWPQGLSFLPSPLNSQAYLIMQPQEGTCIAGTTYEKQFSSDKPDKEVAEEDIFSKLDDFFPIAREFQLVGCRAGVRAGTPNRKPLIAQITDRCWVLTGMGSKGLLYHALFAEELVQRIFLRAI